MKNKKRAFGYLPLALCIVVLAGCSRLTHEAMMLDEMQSAKYQLITLKSEIDALNIKVDDLVKQNDLKEVLNKIP